MDTQAQLQTMTTTDLPRRLNKAASDTATAAELADLATDPDSGVREKVAGNPNATGAVLHQLATDTVIYVLRVVAYHRNTQPRTLMTLWNRRSINGEWDQLLVHNILTHHNRPTGIFTAIISSERSQAGDYHRRCIAGASPPTPPAHHTYSTR